MPAINTFNTIIEEALAGRLPPDGITARLPEPIASMTRIAHGIGRLGRGETIEISKLDTSLLHEVIHVSVDLTLAGKPPRTASEAAMGILTDATLATCDPFFWALQLLAHQGADGPLTVRPV